MLVFNNPWFLLLLGLVPVMWWFSFGSLSGLGRWRRLMALGFRTLVMLLIVAALAEMQYQRVSDRLTVIYLLDQSLSIPSSRRDAMIGYVNASIRDQRKSDKDDRAGVIVFARNAEVELPPVDFSIDIPRVESLLDREFTNLAGAMQRAMSMFPHDAAKRIVLVTDGNQNIGDALIEARSVAEAGVSIDVMPVPLDRRNDVAVEKIALPPDIRRNQPFEVRVVVNNTGDRAVKGRIQINRKAGEHQDTLVDEPREIKPGKGVFPFRQNIDQADFFTYEARFIPDDPAADAISQNNLATAFTHVEGKGLVLLIENSETPGEFDHLVERLRHEGLEVVVQPSNRLFSSLPELQRYDTIILADVPRSSGEDAANVSNFSDDQIKMLVRNTEELGCGLIMIGGPNSFGAGGWTNTELEKAMPVDFQIKSAKVVPVGALVLNMHASEIPQANYWQKVIAQESIKALGPRDYAGLVYFGQSDQWLWGKNDPDHPGMLRVGEGNRQKMLSLIDKMAIGDMPDFDPNMQKAAVGLAGCTDAAVKHMIMISDGDPGAPKQSTINALIKGGVTVTTVLVGDPAHSPNGKTVMQNIANQCGGKFFIVRNSNALPKIFQREARRVARPLVYEPNPPVTPQIVTPHEMVQGLESAFPPVSGFVLTTVKENSLVDVILRSPLPTQPENSAILASWTYGLGKAVAFTTDAGQRWTVPWTGWEQYDRFFTQMVRWSMRPTGDQGKFTVATDVEGNKTRVIVSALDKEDEFVNYQTMSGNVLAPDMQSLPLQMQQTAPGRYVGEFESGKPGSYLISVRAGKASIRTGVSIGYSNEFRDRETNTPLLKSIAELPAKKGEPGKLMPPLPDLPADAEKAEKILQPQLAIDPFRRDLPQAVSRQDIWPLLVLAASCIFFGDVFVRRVQVDLKWLVPIWVRFWDIVLRREHQAATPETMARLRSRKAEVDRSIESRRASARFEPDATAPVDPNAIQAAEADPTATAPSTPPAGAKPVAETEPEDSYTSRLLKAKKQVWKDRTEDRGFDPDAKE